MRKRYYITLLIASFTFLIVSCNDNKSTDLENPQIFDVRLNMNDTIYAYDTIQKEPLVVETRLIILNDSATYNPSVSEVIMIGGSLRFNGRFTDNEGLSSILVKVWGDTLLPAVVDTCYRLKKVPSVNMFGKTEHTMRKIILDTKIPESINGRAGGTFPVREGDEYYFSVRCIDARGNQDSTSYEKKQIVLLTKESIIKANPKE